MHKFGGWSNAPCASRSLREGYDADDYLRRHIDFVLTPGQHRAQIKVAYTSDHRFSRSKRLSRGRKASNLTSLAGNSPATCSRTNADSTMGDNSHRSSTREGNSQARSSTIGDNIRRCRRVESCSFGRSCRTEKGRAAVYQSLPHRLGRKVECSAKGLATKESVAFS
jgi:hypothetical protein